MHTIYALHGFLGRPNDWNTLEWSREVVLRAVDLYAPFFPKPSAGLEQWAQTFMHHYPPSERDVLIGYSLGGRLGLHCLRACPKRWKTAVFISTHPGLQSDSEKTYRLMQDEQWAQAFGCQPWDPLMRAWDSQPIFSGHNWPRHEEDYQRHQLIETLRDWSLANQDDFRPFLMETKCPVLWITGEKDIKSCQLAESVLLSHSQSRKIVMPSVGHRTFFERSDLFGSILQKFLDENSKNASSLWSLN